MPVKDLTVSGSPEISTKTSSEKPIVERPQKVGFVSLGCPKNLVDSEVMMGMLAQAGAELTTKAEDADVIVVNTCSFIASAQQESVNTILEMAQHKSDGRAKKLVVAGCLVERFRDEIRKNIPEVDAVVGTGELEQDSGGHRDRTSLNRADSPFVILRTSRAEGDASRRRKGGSPVSRGMARSRDLPNYLYDETTPRILATPQHMAYIKMAEGCDHPCTFCIIPQLRGKFRSRRFESVIAEAERLAQSGVREITLIGQDTTCYGEDLGLKDGLALLLERLARHRRPSLGTVSCTPIRTRSPASCWRRSPAHEKICSYMDVPLQHASAYVLKRMKRGGRRR